MIYFVHIFIEREIVMVGTKRYCMSARLILRQINHETKENNEK